MSEKSVRDELIKHGRKLYKAPKRSASFTSNKSANNLLNDLADYPHASVLACVMDRQVKTERAWLIPYSIQKKIGGFQISRLAELSLSRIEKLMSKPEPLHRFIKIMAKNFYSAVQRITNVYEGDASAIWEGKPSSAEVVYRFLEFDGVGPKIANMAVNILAREFKIPFADFYSIDISADVHVRRVFSRLGLCATNATPEQVIYKARALYPEFPGLIDLPCWEIGREWCRPRVTRCSDCYVNHVCPTGKRH